MSRRELSHAAKLEEEAAKKSGVGRKCGVRGRGQKDSKVRRKGVKGPENSTKNGEKREFFAIQPKNGGCTKPVGVPGRK